MKTSTRLLIFLIIILLLTDLAVIYPRITSYFSYQEYPRQEVNITKIIDGDTIEIESEETISRARLKGINTPEKNQPYYDEATDFLKNIKDKTVEIENHGQDKYNRILVYVFYKDELLNREILENGLGNLYYYSEDNHYQELKKAEQKARQQEKGIWKSSENTGCIELIKLQYEEPEKLILENNCNKKITLTIKDEATHTYQETIKPKSTLTKTTSHIWNDAGDSVFIWDKSGLLLYYSY